MAFIKRAPATNIGWLTVSFTTESDSEPVSGNVNYVEVDNDEKVVGSNSANIIPLMSAGQLTAITNFLGQIRTKARAEAI